MEEKQNEHTHTHKQLRHFTQHIDPVFLCFVTFLGNGKKTTGWKPTPGHLTPYCKHQTSQLFFSDIKQNTSDSNELELISPPKRYLQFLPPPHLQRYIGIFM